MIFTTYPTPKLSPIFPATQKIPKKPKLDIDDEVTVNYPPSSDASLAATNNASTRTPV